jgi:K+-sensing histidine kinase KdpD
MKGSPPTLPRTLARLIAGLGIALEAALFVFKAPGAFTLTTHLFALWLMLPWIVVLVIAWRGSPPGLLPGTLLAAGFEVIAFHSTFIAPKGSTAALIYAAKPVWQIGLLLAAIVIGLLLRHARRQQ